jgi:hypothetical protein
MYRSFETSQALDGVANRWTQKMTAVLATLRKPPVSRA